jgi:hypothetical protein
MIKEWLTYRIQVVTNRLNYRLDKILARLHILINSVNELIELRELVGGEYMYFLINIMTTPKINPKKIYP